MKITALVHREAIVYAFSLVLLSGLLFSSLSSCDKKQIPPEFAVLTIDLYHHIDNQSVEFEPTEFTNEAGNIYSVTDLNYYISNISLVKSNGEVFRDLNIFYIDIRTPGTCILRIDSIPQGHYSNISFDLGIDEERNVSGSLPNTLENINMIWPEFMGGGYHFLKFEGKFKIDPDTYGFAFHLGKNPMRINYSLNLNKDLKFWNEKLTLKHNLNEWFKSPLTYDFSIHEPYSMNSDSVMMVVRENGKDAFDL